MGIRNALVVLGMLGFSWLFVIGAIYGIMEFYQLLVP